MKPRQPSGDPGALPHVPVRTCVGCRSKASRSVLVRYVLEGDRVVVDENGSKPGRGAWLHPDSDCIALALRRRQFGRALRSPGADVSGAVLPDA
ncbi:YlxR family protein [Demequina muriae]|uniref:YlxR family protein n=1 Tax=Demequina muriae TaxID=3051664 RepID=A0ABT8GDS6_9MICO|nr:YlxR family protein [Demequina sp. EGI L300058]MDN4479583.1 YlxR family protein [Demequina sp. EGI L300058]